MSGNSRRGKSNRTLYVPDGGFGDEAQSKAKRSQQPSGTPVSANDKKLRCYRCGEVGHTRAKCPTRPQRQEARSADAPSQRRKPRARRTRPGRSSPPEKLTPLNVPLSLLKKEMPLMEDQRILAQDAPHPGTDKVKALWSPSVAEPRRSRGAQPSASSSATPSGRLSGKTKARESKYSFPMLSQQLHWCVPDRGTSASAPATSTPFVQRTTRFSAVGVLGRRGVGKSCV